MANKLQLATLAVTHAELALTEAEPPTVAEAEPEEVAHVRQQRAEHPATYAIAQECHATAGAAYYAAEKVPEAELESMIPTHKARAGARPTDDTAVLDDDSDTELWNQLPDVSWENLDADDADTMSGNDGPLPAGAVDASTDSDAEYWSALTEGPYVDIGVNNVDRPVRIETVQKGADSDAEYWNALSEGPYTNVDVEGAGVTSDDERLSQVTTIQTAMDESGAAGEIKVNAGDVQQETGRRSMNVVPDISEDRAALIGSALRARRVTEASHDHYTYASVHDTKIEKYDQPRQPTAKRKATENDGYDGDIEKNVEDLNADYGQLVGLASTDSHCNYAEHVMKFATVAWAYGNLCGAEDQNIIHAAVRSVVRLEMGHGFKIGQRIPGLPACVLVWMANHRLESEIEASTYARNTPEEPHLAHRILYALHVLRQRKFADVVGMHGSRGCILLVRGLIQARTGKPLGDDWAPCLAEVARLLDALARKLDGDRLRNNNNEEVDVDAEENVLTVLFLLDPKATRTVSGILSRRVRELEIMEAKEKTAVAEGAGTNWAKRTKTRHPPSPAKRSSLSPSEKNLLQGGVIP